MVSVYEAGFFVYGNFAKIRGLLRENGTSLAYGLQRMKRVGRENHEQFFYKVTQKGRVIGKEIEENIFSEIRGRSFLATFGRVTLQFGEGVGEGRKDHTQVFFHTFRTPWQIHN